MLNDPACSRQSVAMSRFLVQVAAADFGFMEHRAGTVVKQTSRDELHHVTKTQSRICKALFDHVVSHGLQWLQIVQKQASCSKIQNVALSIRDSSFCPGYTLAWGTCAGDQEAAEDSPFQSNRVDLPVSQMCSLQF